VGLLERDYRGAMFGRSPNGRWIIYERHGHPCLIDARTHTEELLGWNEDAPGSLAPAWSNATLGGSVLWHEKKQYVALDIIQNRKESYVWIWRHPGGLLWLNDRRLLKVVRVPEDQLHLGGGLYTQIKGWDGDELRFEFTYSSHVGENYSDSIVTLGWDPVKDVLRVISRKKGQAWKM